MFGLQSVILSSAGDGTIKEPGVTGNVAIGGGSGSLLKTTVQGNVYVSSTATPDIHSDFFATGSILFKQNLTGSANDALNASASFAALPPTKTLGNVTTSTTITGGSGANFVNVISVNSIQLTNSTLTLVGNKTRSDVFIIDVKSSTADFILNGSQIILSGGVTPDRVLFNFPGTGGKLSIFKSITVGQGTFLAPRRDIVIDNPPVIGAVIGANVDIHSMGHVINPCSR